MFKSVNNPSPDTPGISEVVSLCRDSKERQTVKSSFQNLSITRSSGGLMRPHTLTASFVPVLIGTSLAFSAVGHIDLPVFIAMLVACVLIQGATNVFNEYYDYKRGLDTRESVGIGGVIVRDGFGEKTVFYSAIILLVIALLLGIFICYKSSWLVALVGAVCMLAGYLYSGGPRPIAYSPFGEITTGVLWVLLFCYRFYPNRTVDYNCSFIGTPAVLIGAILMSNNIRDLDGDKKMDAGP